MNDRRLRLAAVVAGIAIVSLWACGSSAGAPEEAWIELEPGLDFAQLEAPTKSWLGDSVIRVLRIDPEPHDSGVPR